MSPLRLLKSPIITLVGVVLQGTTARAETQLPDVGNLLCMYLTVLSRHGSGHCQEVCFKLGTDQTGIPFGVKEVPPNGVTGKMYNVS